MIQVPDLVGGGAEALGEGLDVVVEANGEEPPDVEGHARVEHVVRVQHLWVELPDLKPVRPEEVPNVSKPMLPPHSELASQHPECHALHRRVRPPAHPHPPHASRATKHTSRTCPPCVCGGRHDSVRVTVGPSPATAHGAQGRTAWLGAWGERSAPSGSPPSTERASSSRQFSSDAVTAYTLVAPRVTCTSCAGGTAAPSSWASRNTGGGSASTRRSTHSGADALFFAAASKHVTNLPSCPPQGAHSKSIALGLTPRTALSRACAGRPEVPNPTTSEGSSAAAVSEKRTGKPTKAA
mmetsp:Transcript_53333/g.130279  ORF Transcript_53333/g.130279 Transcript_53333/m.130279 type:complete len:296 (-) Transcript_53333:140-1027(-)